MPRLKKNSIISSNTNNNEDSSSKLLEKDENVIDHNDNPEGENKIENFSLKVFELKKEFILSKKKLKKILKDKDEKERLLIEAYNNETNSEVENNELVDNKITYDGNNKKFIYRIVNNVSYDVNIGECLGLLGPNGSGKTTSISMIIGFISRTHGKIMYGKNDINTTALSDLSLGYVPQKESLWEELTVKETIEFYLNICGYPKHEIPNCTQSFMELYGIEKHANKKVENISVGTRRKLSLIMAICSSPRYLILDEPCAGMDPFSRRYMWSLLKEIKDTNQTAIILTTHYIQEVEALCDRIAFLIDGRIVGIDSLHSIRMNNNNNYMLEVFSKQPENFEEFVNSNNLFRLEPNEKYTVETFTNYQKYIVKMKTENIANVFFLMEQAKERLLVYQYNFGQYSLEQVFYDFVNNQ